MKTQKTNLRNELHCIVNAKLLKKMRIDGVKKGIGMGKLVELMAEKYYQK